jgi:UDP-N-acetylmuramate--alanine ligase
MQHKGLLKNAKSWLLDMYKSIRRIHFVGIGGIGMSGIAEILLTLGYEVSGSDLKRSPVTDRLRRRGAKIRFQHKAEHIEKAQVLVVSSAINKKNPELQEAMRQGIPVIARGEMLAELMRLKYGIAVAGSHGKTSTTSLIASLLQSGGIDPTVVIGGRVRSLRSNARLGKGDFLVAEADESDGSFLRLQPTIAVVTNIDPEHMDHYKDYDELKNCFRQFCEKIPFYGNCILCVDHPATAAIAKTLSKRVTTYGLQKKADFRAKNVRSGSGSMFFDVLFKDKVLGKVTLPFPGKHNVSNALAAIAVAHELGVPFFKIRRALKQFKGIGRRLEIVWKSPSLMIIDDYAHHPAEILATLEAIKKSWKGFRIRTVFQPHRYTRTKELFTEFTQAFGNTQELIVTDIYAASEVSIVGISGKKLAHSIKNPKSTQYMGDHTAIERYLWESRGKHDLIVTLGAGNVGAIAHALVKRCRES